MKRVLITGMSGTGKSTVIRALATRGYAVVDTDDDGWHEWAETPGHPEAGIPAGSDWIWREDRMRELLAREDGELLFVSGTASNQGRFYDRFDHVILLSAPKAVIIERLTTRTTNPYGKRPEELAETLDYLATVEPLLRRGATLEIDTRAPLDEVVAAILDHARSPGRRGGRL
jgi:adenylate kinase family enzyme